MRLFLAALLLLIPLNVVHADETDPVFKLGQNQSLLHISATERREVDQDLLVATLRIETENEDNAMVQNTINIAMKEALDSAKKYGDVKAITRGYNVYSYDKNSGKRNLPRFIMWKGQQSVQLKSQNPDDLLKLAGEIQAMGFVMSGLNYTLSPALSAQIHDDMLEAALEKLQNRASRAAKALGKTKAELKEINTQRNFVPQPKIYARAAMMEMAADTAVAAPVASPGETTMTMTVSAKALLR